MKALKSRCWTLYGRYEQLNMGQRRLLRERLSYPLHLVEAVVGNVVSPKRNIVKLLDLLEKEIEMLQCQVVFAK